MQVKLIRTREELSLYKDQWDAILALQQNDNPFIEYAWFDKWWDILGKNETVKVYVVEHEQEIVAFFPFSVRKKWGVNIVSITGEGIANYTGFVASTEWQSKSLEIVLKEIMQTYQHLLFSFHGLLESQRSSEVLEQYLVEQQRRYRIFRVITPFLSFNDVDFPNLYKSRRKMHGGDRREKKLRKLGLLSCQTPQSEELWQMFKLFDRRWSKKIDTSDFSVGKKRDFFEVLAHVEGEAIQVEVDALIFEQQWLAFVYGICCRGRYVVYALGYEPYFDQFGPGRLVFQETMKRAFSENYQLFDLSIGYEPYKFDWHSGIDFTRRVMISGETKRTKFLFKCLTLKEQLKEKLKKNRHIVHLKRNVVGNLYYLWKNGRLTDWFSYMKDTLSKIISYHQVDLYELRAEDFPLVRRNLVGSLFEEVPIQQVMEHDCIENVPLYYQGYTLYKEKHMETCQIAFCLHEQLWRIDALQIVQQLTRDTIFIENYEVKNIPIISSFLRNNYPQKTQLTTLAFWQWRKKKILVEIGFQRIAKAKQIKCMHYKRNFFKKMTQSGGKQHSYN